MDIIMLDRRRFETNEYAIKTQTDRERHDPFCKDGVSRPLLAGFLFFFDLNNFAPVIKAAFRANGVRKAHGTAIGACNGVHCCQCVLRTAAVAAPLGMFALGMWGHLYFLLYTYIRRALARLINF